MTEQLLRLHRAIERATRRSTMTSEQRRELRLAFAGLLGSLKGADLPDLSAIERLQAALDDCHAAKVPIGTIAEATYGASSLLTLMERG